MASQLAVQGSFAGTSAAINIQSFITVNTPLNGVTTIALASGYNSITVPAGSTFALIVLPVGNATSVTLKGPTGDTGIALLPTGVTLIQLANSVTTIGLTAGGAIAAITNIYFI